MKAGVEIQLRQIEKQLDYNLSKLPKPVAEQTAKRLIRDAALKVYEVGTGYVCDFVGVHSFIADEDFAAVGKITDDVYRTWYYGGRMDSALIALTSITLAKAVVGKAKQITLMTAAAAAGARGRPTTEMRQLKKMLDVPFEDVPMIEDLTEEAPDTTLVFVWETQGDALVCDICEPLDGQEWDFEDSDIPVPVDDTHPNCRCRVNIERRTAAGEEEG